MSELGVSHFSVQYFHKDFFNWIQPIFVVLALGLEILVILVWIWGLLTIPVGTSEHYFHLRCKLQSDMVVILWSSSYDYFSFNKLITKHKRELRLITL